MMTDKTQKRDEEEPPRIRVVDRRRVTEEGAVTPEVPEPSVDSAPAESAVEGSDVRAGPDPEESVSDADDEAGEGQIPIDERAVGNIPVGDLARVFLVELHARAWIHMGLLADPATHLAIKNLPEARLAIDCVAALVEAIGPTASPAERDELRRMLADLRMNFVQQSGA